jgi:glycosyltransferase involved in cell wall biosynthesis
MKILFPVEVFYPSQAGGPANTVYWLAKNLKELGFEPTIVASNKGINSNVPLNRWQDSPAGRLIFVKTAFLHFPLGQTLISFVGAWRSEVVHLSSFFYPAAFLSALAARVLGRKIALSPRGELDEYSLNYSGRRKRPILWMMRKAVGGHAVFHSTSDEETAHIRRLFGPGTSVFQIPNYIEVEPEVARKSGNYLLYMGRIHPKKAIDALIKAAAISGEFRRSGFVLKIAGHGKPEHRQALSNVVADLNMTDKVEFLGQVEGPAKSQLYADAHFTFMPSHSENFGIVVLESLAQNTPVVASVHTPWSVLEKERIGFWSENSPEALASAIDRVLTMDAGQYEEYRSRCRPFVVREFDIRNHMDEWLEMYSSLRKTVAKGQA